MGGSLLSREGESSSRGGRKLHVLPSTLSSSLYVERAFLTTAASQKPLIANVNVKVAASVSPPAGIINFYILFYK
jgi:hypothetical protein